MDCTIIYFITLILTNKIVCLLEPGQICFVGCFFVFVVTIYI